MTPTNHNGCIKPAGEVYAGRTAWFRFNPGVDGRLVVTASAGYDAVLNIHVSANAEPWGLTEIGGHLSSATCADQVATGDETAAVETADGAYVYFIQVGSKCPGDSTTCNDPGIVGGITDLRVTFTPFDADADGVPDTSDTCPATPSRTRVNSAGCPDQDGDGIADSDDDCVTLPGVPASAPFNGCPASPTPPGGTPRVTIISLAGDPLNTGSPQVLLKLDWRQGTRKVLVDNGVGDAPQQVDFTHGAVPWTLPPTSKSETRQVNVQFLGPGIDDSRSDTITLDTQAPTVPKTTVLPPAAGRWAVGLKSSDGKDGSGVKSVTALDKRKHALGKPLVCKKSCASFLDSLVAKKRPKYLRVEDRAGNVRVVRLGAAERGCRILVLAYNPPTDTACFKLGSSCTRQDTKVWNFAQRGIACRKGVVVKARTT